MRNGKGYSEKRGIMGVDMRRQGTVMIMLLMAILVGGFVAIRLIPDVEIQERRQKDVQLKLALSQIRQAISLRAFSDPGYNPDFSSPAAIASELADLEARNFLPSAKILRDRHVPAHRWGTGANDVYWQVVQNYASNTSFELMEEAGIVPTWGAEASTTLALDSFYPSSPSGDDFPGENKLGVVFGSKGHSLRIDL